ncbi:MAG: hypothetical protein M3Y33_09785 [Actinomycetota bacterium]|nr:hypothetical protein [Actinomycetota bacterium]
MLQQLDVPGVIDEVTGARPAGQPLSTGTYLALAALGRLAAPWRPGRRPGHDRGLRCRAELRR